jgi:flagellar hook-associated protein FlgK
VDLNEEAANLVQLQQAYQASAQAFQIGNSTFTTFMQAVNAG